MAVEQSLASFGYLATGIVLGASIAMPLGPMKVLCLRRVIAFGAAAGAATAAGVVTGDAIFVAIAALGLTAVKAALHSAAPVLRLMGGGVLLYLAVDAMRRGPPAFAPRVEGSRLISMYAGTVGLTLANPITIVMFATILASGEGIDAMDRGGGAVPLGMVLGSALVWIAFTIISILAGRSLTSSRLIWLNRAAAVLFVYFGVSALLSGLRLMF